MQNTPKITEENIFNHNVKEMAILNNSYNEHKTYTGQKFSFFHEPMSDEVKIKLLDRHTEGKVSKYLTIIQDFEAEKDTLKKDNCGHIKSVSLVAWIKRQNKKHGVRVVDYKHSHFDPLGSFKVFKDTYKINPWAHEDNTDIIDELFIELLCDLRGKELTHKNSIDPRKVKTEELVEYYDLTHTYFDNEELGHIVWNPHHWKDNNEKDLDHYLAIYEKVIPMWEDYNSKIMEVFKEMNIK